MARKQVVDIAKEFAKKIKGSGIPLEKTILFGSWVKGTARPDSDIDLCLVSSSFGKDEIGEMQYLLGQTLSIDDRIEPVPVSFKDYEENATPLILEIKKYGVEV